MYAGWQYHPIFVTDAPIELRRSTSYAIDAEVLMRSMVSTCPRVGARCYPRFLGITRRSCIEAHRSWTWSIESRIDLSMALEGPSFFSFIRFIFSKVVASITFVLDLYQRRLLLHEVIGPGIMVCVTFGHYNL
jgi:hypothetical protein